MAENHLWFSGSSAADIFVPGTRDGDSDLDFYTHYNKQCVGGSMRLLEAQGVVWEDPFDQIQTLLDAKTPICIHMHRAKVLGMYYKEPPSQQLGAVLQSICGLLDGRRADESISEKVGEHGTLTIDGHGFEGYGLGISLVTGHTTYGKKTKVQLIFAKGRTPLEHIMAFHASHVQCAITPYGMFHMYHEKAVQQRAYLWSDNRQHPEGVLAAVAKYKKRGFSFDERHTHKWTNVITHLLGHDGSRLFEFNLPLPLSAGMDEERREEFKQLAWREEGGKTRTLTTGRDEPGWEPDDRNNEEDSFQNRAILDKYLPGGLAGVDTHPCELPAFSPITLELLLARRIFNTA